MAMSSALPACHNYTSVLRFACQLISCDSVPALLASFGYGDGTVAGTGATVKLFRVCWKQEGGT